MRRVLALFIVLVSGAVVAQETSVGMQTTKALAGAEVSQEGQQCLACHAENTPGIVVQWSGSAHARQRVDCYGCHRANLGDPATFDHYGQRIAVLVTPLYCARCHKTEVEQFERSWHAEAAHFIGSLESQLNGMVEAAPEPAAMNGCRQCHGSEVRYQGEGKFDCTTWPNSGIGRINPDGSKGTCAACHTLHRFSRAQARQPETCGRCHMGRNPQFEVYNQSKHGIEFRANMGEMNLGSQSWIVGKDYSVAPTCATCHISATSRQRVTHDVDERITSTLRPLGRVKLENPDKRRAAMQEVCSNCHARGLVENFYNGDLRFGVVPVIPSSGTPHPGPSIGIK
jgi:formate-dependent nitrite reductase cytochrome c552 subunit